MDNSTNLPSATAPNTRPHGFRLPKLLLPALVMLMLTGSAWALGPDMALSNSGDIVRVRTGSFGELFPGQDGFNPAHKVLALDFEYPDGVERHLVPYTGSWRPDRHPTLAYDSRNDAVMLMWVAGAADGTWSMELTSFRDGEWQHTSNVQSNNSTVFFEGLPKVVVTTDDFFLDLGEDVEPLESRRTTFHAVWHEGDRVRYAAVPFVDGVFIGWTEALDLSYLVYQARLQQQAGGDELPPGFVPESLAGTLNLGPAVDPHAITVSLTDAGTGHLANIRIEETPMSLAHLAGRVRDDILAEAGAYSPQDLEALSEYIRSEIIFIGAKCRLHPTVGRYLADEISGWLRANGHAYGTDVAAMGHDAWRQALDAGASIYAKTLGSLDSGEDPVLDLEDPNSPQPHLAELNELLRVTLPASFEAPMIGEGDTVVYSSADHRSMLVAWKNAESQTLHYVENLGLGWTTPLALQLSDTLSEATAHELLQRKIR